MFSSRTKKFLFASIAALVLSLSVYVYLLWLVNQQGGDLLAAIQLIEDDRSVHATSQAILVAFEESKEERELLDSFVIKDDEDASAFLSLVETVALEQGVAISTEKLQVVPTEEGSFDNLSMTFNLQGPSENVKRVIALMETLPYQQRVVELTLRESVEENTGLEGVKARIHLLVSVKEGNI